DFVELLEKILSSGEVNAVKFFKKTEFIFSQKEEAEKALEIINSKDDIHNQFWSSLRIREEKTTTNTVQIILQKKEEQNACQIRTNLLEENIKLLTEDDDKLIFDDKLETDSNDEVNFDSNKVFSIDQIQTDDDEDIPLEESFISASSSSEIWTLPSSKNFCVDDRKFISNDHESMLQIPELAPEESLFILKVEESENQVNILDFTPKSTHTEVDVIVNLEVYSTWSTNYANGCKYDVRFLSASGVNVEEWEFFTKVIANKTIGDRCRSSRINQSILNRLLKYNFNDDQFELPIKLRDIGKLKTTINVIKLVMEIYERTCETIENLETFHHKFDDVFNGDYHFVDKPTHFKYKYIRRC
ncbi:10810_t:CDS:10, partial [Scutellospora calospora]